LSNFARADENYFDIHQSRQSDAVRKIICENLLNTVRLPSDRTNGAGRAAWRVRIHSSIHRLASLPCRQRARRRGGFARSGGAKTTENRPSDRISKQKNGTCSQNIYGNIIDLSHFAPAARRPIDAIALESIG
jgi:hypothetical protein